MSNPLLGENTYLVHRTISWGLDSGYCCYTLFYTFDIKQPHPIVLFIHTKIQGSIISLISKKNIRYEGTLYSINESDATVALQTVKSFGTEGRELLDTTGSSKFVPPNDVVHTYLLFRGQDIKDLHVHENQNPDPAPAPAAKEETPAAAADPAQSTSTAKPPAPAKKEAAPRAESKPVGEKKKTAAAEPAKPKKVESFADKAKAAPKDAPKAAPAAKQSDSNNDSKENKPGQPKKGGGNKGQQKNMVGTGASLLNRKARGAKGDQGKILIWCWAQV